MVSLIVFLLILGRGSKDSSVPASPEEVSGSKGKGRPSKALVAAELKKGPGRPKSSKQENEEITKQLDKESKAKERELKKQVKLEQKEKEKAEKELLKREKELRIKEERERQEQEEAARILRETQAKEQAELEKLELEKRELEKRELEKRELEKREHEKQEQEALERDKHERAAEEEKRKALSVTQQAAASPRLRERAHVENGALTELEPLQMSTEASVSASEPARVRSKRRLRSLKESSSVRDSAKESDEVGRPARHRKLASEENPSQGPPSTRSRVAGPSLKKQRLESNDAISLVETLPELLQRKRSPSPPARASRSTLKNKPLVSVEASSIKIDIEESPRQLLSPSVRRSMRARNDNPPFSSPSSSRGKVDCDEALWLPGALFVRNETVSVETAKGLFPAVVINVRKNEASAQAASPRSRAKADKGYEYLVHFPGYNKRLDTWHSESTIKKAVKHSPRLQAQAIRLGS